MEISLTEEKHPNKVAREAFGALVGLDAHKEQLIDELLSILDRQRVLNWNAEHHQGKLVLVHRLVKRAPLILLSGEVGCGKTALARSVGTPLADALDKQVMVYETPSDLRGSGMVGEISARITGAFQSARSQAKGKPALLILDEADDIGTSRGQLQAHHEDRAGLNVLLRQIDLIARDKVPLAVVLITNREDVLDPALRRRVALHLRFNRPDAAQRRALFVESLRGVTVDEASLDSLVEASARDDVPYSSGDLVERVVSHALRACMRANRPFSAEALLEALAVVQPSPLIEPIRL